MRIVVKVGTSTLAHPTGRLNIQRMERLCKVLSDLKNAGHEIILVSSGAIGMGVGKLSLPSKPSDMPTKQAAAAVGQWLGMTQEEIAEGVGHFVNSKMRMDTVRCGDGVTVLNDTYNANPQSMRAALEVLSKFDGDYKVAVLGDMLELGDLGSALHESVGKFVVSCGIDCLVAVGTLAENIYNAAQAGGKVECYYRPTKEEAKAVLDQVIRKNTTVLCKASRGMAMEELVEYIKEIRPEG